MLQGCTGKGRTCRKDRTAGICTDRRQGRRQTGFCYGRRSDNGKWALICGINEPGEQPADTVAREVKEETGVDVIVTDLVSVISDSRVVTYMNGDNTQYMDHSFLCELKPGGNAKPFVGDDESLEVGWFDWDDLPEPMTASSVERLALFRRYLDDKAHGEAHTLFKFDGVLN